MMLIRRNFLSAVAIVAATILCVGDLPTAESRAVEALTAVSSQPVYPVLIRNEHGPLTRVVVVAEQGTDARVESFVFHLDGTDDLDDLESLALYATGDKDEFSPMTPIGERAQPAKEVTFRTRRKLSAGKHVFWLSCRLKPTANLSHRVAATCTLIETTSGKLTPREASPDVRHRIGVALRKHQDDGVHTYRIPALATSAKGTLLCVYDMRRRMGRDLQEDIDIGRSRSTDGGQSWEPVRVIMDMGEYGGLPQEQNGCSDPGIIVDRQTGEMFCFAVWMNGKPAFSGGNECQAAQLGDGSIMLNMRNDHERFRAVFVTKDVGQTWQPHETNRNTLIEPNCNGSLLRVDYEEAGEKRHVLLFANPHTQQGRTHHTIQVSFDDGRT